MIDQKLACCFHEAGHAAIAYYFRHALHTYDLTFADGRGHFRFLMYGDGAYVSRVLKKVDRAARDSVIRSTERDLLRLLGGPVAEYLARGCDPLRKAIRFSTEYRSPTSDSSRIRDLLRGLTGKDDKAYQLRLQHRCKEILTHPQMWSAIQEIADRLHERGAVKGEEAERLFEQFEAPQVDYSSECVIGLSTQV